MIKSAEIKFKAEYPNFFLNNNCVYAIDGRIFSKVSEGRLHEVKEFSKLLRTLNLPNKYFYFEDYPDKRIGSLFSTETGSFCEILDFTKFEIELGKENIVLLTNREFPQTTLFDISKNEIIWVKEKYFSFQILNENILIDIDNEKKSLIRYDFATGEPLWQYDVPSKFDWESQTYIGQIDHNKADIQRLIGVYEGILWVTLNNGRLLGLNIENGNLVYNIMQANHYITDKETFSQYYGKDPIQNPEWGQYLGNYLQLDEKKGVLFGLQYYYYFEIDLKNPSQSYTVYDVADSFKHWQIEIIGSISQGSWHGNEIYFGYNRFGTHVYNNSGGNNLGIFDRQKREVVWATRIEGDNGQVRNLSKIEYATGKVYALDQSQTLHIFERKSPA